MLHSDKKRKKNAAQEVDGVRKEKERLTAVSLLVAVNPVLFHFSFRYQTRLSPDAP